MAERAEADLPRGSKGKNAERGADRKAGRDRRGMERKKRSGMGRKIPRDQGVPGGEKDRGRKKAEELEPLAEFTEKLPERRETFQRTRGKAERDRAGVAVRRTKGTVRKKEKQCIKTR